MDATNKNIGFIGAGNMATALIKGLVQSGTYNSGQLLASDNNKKALEKISDLFGLKCSPSNRTLVKESAIVVLSVKPQIMGKVLEEVKDDIREDNLFISIAAGIPLKMIRTALGREMPLIRVMPNTPALVQKGMSALARGSLVTDEHMEAARGIFCAVGDTVEVKESMMDAVTALSGSGPGFIFRFMECMVEAGVDSGLDKATSLRLVVQTFLGAAHLAKESDNSLSGLREMVTSPGGTTAAGLAMFERMGLEKIIQKAIEAAFKRSIELGK